ncbi:MAG: hypothetical protein ACD_76C00094G0004 [uncultured bacterium]|nr:MAG: hypothetical protein ACD_76C00094G0004 [uncultured bacterium]
MHETLIRPLFRGATLPEWTRAKWVQKTISVLKGVLEVVFVIVHAIGVVACMMMSPFLLGQTSLQESHYVLFNILCIVTSVAGMVVGFFITFPAIDVFIDLRVAWPHRYERYWVFTTLPPKARYSIQPFDKPEVVHVDEGEEFNDKMADGETPKFLLFSMPKFKCFRSRADQMFNGWTIDVGLEGSGYVFSMRDRHGVEIKGGRNWPWISRALLFGAPSWMAVQSYAEHAEYLRRREEYFLRTLHELELYFSEGKSSQRDKLIAEWIANVLRDYEKGICSEDRMPSRKDLPPLKEKKVG